jgi:hypothetical protein
MQVEVGLGRTKVNEGSSEDGVGAGTEVAHHARDAPVELTTNNWTPEDTTQVDMELRRIDLDEGSSNDGVDGSVDGPGIDGHDFNHSHKNKTATKEADPSRASATHHTGYSCRTCRTRKT